MKSIAGLGLVGGLALGGCALSPVTTTTTPTTATALPCPDGQEPMRLAQLFFGRKVGSEGTVSEADFRRFVDEEITPRFPAGLTVLDGGGQWRGSENQLIREASKVVLIVMPSRNDRTKVNQVRDAYKARFSQESVLLVTQQTCVSF